jgi:hypothetical protein
METMLRYKHFDYFSIRWVFNETQEEIIYVMWLCLPKWIPKDGVLWEIVRNDFKKRVSCKLEHTTAFLSSYVV